MCSLQVDSQYFDKICNGVINHLVVCKEEGIEQGDCVSLRKLGKTNISCVVKVEYVDCEGSGVDENYVFLELKEYKKPLLQGFPFFH